MLTLRGVAPPSSGSSELTASEVNELLHSMEDTATRYAVLIAWKWSSLRPDIEDLKAGVIEVMWEAFIQAESHGPLANAEAYLRACVFKQQSRLVAHTLGFSHEYQVYKWMRLQSNSASYYSGLPTDEQIEATDSDIKRLEDRRYLSHILEACNMKGIRKEIMQLVLHGMGPKEISTRLNKSIQWVSWNKQQGIQTMREFAERHNLSYF